MDKTVKILIYIVILALFTSLGFFVGKVSDNNKIKEYETLKQNIDKFFPQPPKEVFSFGGAVKKASDTQVIVEINSFPKSNYPWDEPQEIKKEQRIVKITKDTKLKKVVIDPFSEPDFTQDGLPKEPEEKSFKLSELKPGDYIQVKTVENAKANEKVTAKEIIFQFVKSPSEEELRAKRPEIFPELENPTPLDLETQP